MIEIITTSFFVFTSIYGGPTVANVDNSSTSTDLVTPAQIEETTTTNIPTKNEIEAKAKKFFKNDQILVDIARCESQFRQYDENGKVLLGKVNKGDIGVMQINKYYHADRANKLGYDLYTVEGNMAYAQHLYNREGAQPWISSSKCWNKEMSSAPANQIAVI